ncbi:MAG: hypothetical protein C0508_29685 [Cyanobacteria bacterium PR.023]|nr:hypothetical protein [Cyanobacteria bacterium PR.023]
MDFYHVVVRLKDAPHKSVCLFSNLSEVELKKQFISAYNSGAAILANDQVVETVSIVSTVIRRTNRTSEEERKDMQEQSRRKVDAFNRSSPSVAFFSIGCGYAEEDIVEAGTDVTAEYIASPPGQKKASFLSVALNHPWASAIITGVIVAGIVKVLGWV